MASSPGVAKELPMTCTKGITHSSAKPLRMITLITRNPFSPRVRGRCAGFARLRPAGGRTAGAVWAATDGDGEGVVVMRGSHR